MCLALWVGCPQLVSEYLDVMPGSLPDSSFLLMQTVEMPVVARMSGFLSSTWEIWIEFLASGLATLAVVAIGED